jgi:hypothetical protein
VVAEVYEAHARWVGQSKSKDSQAERDALMKHARANRDIASSLKKEADFLGREESYANAEHDPKLMDPRLNELMTRQATLERELASLLTKDAEMADSFVKEQGRGGAAQ